MLLSNTKGPLGLLWLHSSSVKSCAALCMLPTTIKTPASPSGTDLLLPKSAMQGIRWAITVHAAACHLSPVYGTNKLPAQCHVCITAHAIC